VGFRSATRFLAAAGLHLDCEWAALAIESVARLMALFALAGSFAAFVANFLNSENVRLRKLSSFFRLRFAFVAWFAFAI
jgi:hypothetical protein